MSPRKLSYVGERRMQTYNCCRYVGFSNDARQVSSDAFYLPKSNVFVVLLLDLGWQLFVASTWVNTFMTKTIFKNLELFLWCDMNVGREIHIRIANGRLVVCEGKLVGITECWACRHDMNAWYQYTMSILLSNNLPNRYQNGHVTCQILRSQDKRILFYLSSSLGP